MAEKLIEEMTEPWKPEKYHDSYREDLMKRINEKIRSKETHTLTEAPKAKPQKSAEIIDLMAVLKQSLGKGRNGGRARRPARHARKKAARA
jgi:DNA end-binding protein Ku